MSCGQGLIRDIWDGSAKMDATDNDVPPSAPFEIAGKS